MASRGHPAPFFRFHVTVVAAVSHHSSSCPCDASPALLKDALLLLAGIAIAPAEIDAPVPL
jgi:hypothetical protein